MKTTIITFSPTGRTLKCAEALAQGIGEIVQEIDLTAKRLDDYTSNPAADVSILAIPSYGGRVPSLAVERLKKIDGQGKPAVLLVVYGNRAFEDTLVEMEDIAKAQGFNVIAAVAAIAQHCMDGKIATNCPAAAISVDDPTKIDSKICLGCMRCVALCPSKSKRLPASKRLLVHTFLSLTAGKRKEPQLFI